MKKICMTFLACASIIGSAQCLYAADQEMPLTKELHKEEKNMKKLDIDKDTAYLSPEFIQLSSMKIDRQVDEEETEIADPYTINDLMQEKTLEHAAKGDQDKADGETGMSIAIETRETSNSAKEAEPHANKEEAAEAEQEVTMPVVENAADTERETVAPPKEEMAEEPVAETEDTTEPCADETVLTVTATAYTADCEGGSGVTYTGVDLKANPDAKVIAVDPSVIPLGTEVYVEGYGHAVAADIGGAIKGNKIDVFIPRQAEAESWGVQTVDVTIKH